MGTRTDPLSRAWRWFNVGIGGLAVLVGLGLVWNIWSSSGGFPPPAPCEPPAYHLQADHVRAGADVVVEAPDASCDPRYGHNAQVEVRLLDANQHQLTRVLAPMNDAGGFSARMTLPQSLAPGVYLVSATPYELGTCFDTNHRAGREDGRDEAIVPASCAEPVKLLTVSGPVSPASAGPTGPL
ncbi:MULTISPECIES: hypothetical protein [Arthrobacter]|uniref:Secreted protein n=2 Tax=Arthrobacter TaxID=1663 RepID=A0ABU9KS39_9MICC|nr:hypothetical protein [Arthrobacter sp. YJM1]MDP5228703.1 hypothetical protein [Arthrobacter sp. YJM1]